MRAQVAYGDLSDTFEIPVWRDLNGMLRIAFPKVNPTHATDCGQIIIAPSALLEAIGKALR